MIVLTLVAGVTIVTVSSLLFAWQLDPRRGRRALFAEKRRVLERDRGEWVLALSGSSATEATEEISKIDKKLLALADEEARTYAQEA
jgi:hypothetical protein